METKENTLIQKLLINFLGKIEHESQILKESDKEIAKNLLKKIEKEIL